MEFNSILFPGPGIALRTPREHMIYIPRGKLEDKPVPDGQEEAKDGWTNLSSVSFSSPKATQVADETSTHIPCMFVPAESNKVMIYFHGNAEDLAIGVDFVHELNRYINVNVLAMEYPGYGLYKLNGEATE